MNYLDIKKARIDLEEGIKEYNAVSISCYLREQNLLLDMIDYLQKENESLKKQVSNPIIKEKIVYRKR